MLFPGASRRRPRFTFVESTSLFDTRGNWTQYYCNPGVVSVFVKLDSRRAGQPLLLPDPSFTTPPPLSTPFFSCFQSLRPKTKFTSHFLPTPFALTRITPAPIRQLHSSPLLSHSSNPRMRPFMNFSFLGIKNNKTFLSEPIDNAPTLWYNGHNKNDKTLFRRLFWLPFLIPLPSLSTPLSSKKTCVS